MANFSSRLIEFIKASYHASPKAFYCEMVETTLLIIASAILTFTVLDPATTLFVPLYLLGSILGGIACVLRKAFFAVVLCGWFTVMYSVALIQLYWGF